MLQRAPGIRDRTERHDPPGERVPKTCPRKTDGALRGFAEAPFPTRQRNGIDSISLNLDGMVDVILTVAMIVRHARWKTSRKEYRRPLWRAIMLRNADSLQGFHLHARDGNIGHIDDFLFDDERWKVRYVVVDTRQWLPGRKVLLIPEILGLPKDDAKAVPTELTREQVKGSPDIDADQPVSRQMEIDLFEYYGWSPYWGGGHGGFTTPVMADVDPEKQELSGASPPGDPYLRSVRAIDRYSIEAEDGKIGHTKDFLLEDADWSVRYLVVDTRKWLPGGDVVISTASVERIHWKGRSVAVRLSKEQVRSSPTYHPGQPIDEPHVVRPHQHAER